MLMIDLHITHFLQCAHKGSGIMGVTGFTITAISSGVIRSKLKREVREPPQLSLTTEVEMAPTTFIMVPNQLPGGQPV